MSKKRRPKPRRLPNNLVGYKRVKPRMWNVGELLPRCFASGKSKVCYDTHMQADMKRAASSVPLRVYLCDGHYHLTSRV